MSLQEQVLCCEGLDLSKASVEIGPVLMVLEMIALIFLPIKVRDFLSLATLRIFSLSLELVQVSLLNVKELSGFY